MVEYEFSEHAQDMLGERNIKLEWVERVLNDPDIKEQEQDGTVHYLCQIPEYGHRYLRVVVNPDSFPRRIVTLFFDRRIGRSV